MLVTCREEKEKIEKEIVERERLRNMTEEERAAWDRANPKVRSWASAQLHRPDAPSAPHLWLDIITDIVLMPSPPPS